MSSRVAFVVGTLAGVVGGACFGIWHGRRTAPERIVEVVREKPAAATTAAGDAGKAAPDATPAKEERKGGGLGLGKPEPEAPASTPRPGFEIASFRQAIALLSSATPEERSAAVRWLRDRLYAASATEWAELDAALAAALAVLPVEERARLLESLFGARGWMLEDAGPALREGRLRELFLETARTAPEGSARAEMLRALSSQMMSERGVSLMEYLNLLEAEADGEMSRLEGLSGAPMSDSAAALVLELYGGAGSLGRPVESIEDLVGLVPLASPQAGEAERALLLSYATEHTDARARGAALLLLGGVGSSESEGVLTRVAADGNKPVSDRVMAYLALRRSGRDGQLSEETRREVLKAWKDSGVKEAEDFLDE